MADKPVRRADGRVFAALAEAQHGVVSAAQLYAVGFSRDQVSERVRAGWLHRLHRGVYAVGRRPIPQTGVWLAATLAAGEGAVLSHTSAAELWEIRKWKTGWGKRVGPEAAAEIRVHVTRPRAGGMLRRQGLILHRTTTLRDDELTRHREIPVTVPARTLLDLATQFRGRALERAVDEAERLRLCDVDELKVVMARHRGEPGAGPLGRVLASHDLGSTVTRSELEERFLAVCRSHRLPQPLFNVRLHDLRVDCLWEPAKLVVEVDGRSSHHTHRAFQDDRDRDSLLAAHGYLTLRFTWWDVTKRPAVVAHRLRKVLTDRGG